MKRRSDNDLRQSDAQWLGKVPLSWGCKRLKFAAHQVDQRMAGDSAEQPYIGLEHIESWTGRLTVDDNSESAGIVNVFKKDDVLFGKLRPYLAKVHHAQAEGVCSTETLVLRPSAELSARFLFYFLANPLAIANINSSTYGAKMPRANWDFIGDQFQLIPSLSEQHCITTFLDRETARIDRLISKKQRLLEVLEEQRLALITRAVTKGLKDSLPTKDSGIDWLGAIPAHWKIKTLKRIARRIDVGIAEAATHAYADAGVPIIRTTNVSANYIDINDIRHIDPTFAERNRSKFLYTGDLLTVRTGVPGTTAVVPEELNGSQCFTMLMTTLEADMVPQYFSAYLNSQAARAYFATESWGAAQNNISVPILGYTPVVVPPPDEQAAIAAYVGSASANFSRTATAIRRALETLREYRFSLITNAVTGKIDVRGVEREEAAA
jgi:type I restriction enzyme S subunit